MQRIALGLEYCGSQYFGWQIQKEQISVQQALESALSKVAAHPICVIAAGRTDTHVHALGQVVHFDTQAIRPMDAWLRGVNTHLPKDIRIRWVKTVDQSFHARFSALNRRYIYLIHSDKVSPGLCHQGVTWVHYPLDIQKMSKASKALLGEHDFSSFRSSDCQAKTPVRHIYDLKISEWGPLICLDITANAFLHHMVRNIVGTLLQIGRGNEPVDFAKMVLEAKDRSKAPNMASPKGLYLAHVDYPSYFGLPNKLNSPWFFPKIFQNQEVEPNINKVV